MDINLIAAIGIAVVAIVAISIAVGMRFRIIYMQDVLAAAYQLAGELVNDDDTEDAVRRMGPVEYNAACLMLLDTLADPDGPEARALLDMDRGTDYYDQVLMNAKRIRADDEGINYRGPYIPTQ